MENNFIASSVATDLSQLILSAKPLEVLSIERNQEDNQKVLAFVNGFLDIVDAELANTKSYKDYVIGKKDTFIRSEMVSRLELVASRILEKKTLGCSTVNMEELNFFQEELNFMVDLYYLLVTSLIDLSAIRKADLVDKGPHTQLYDIIKDHMSFIGTYPELQSLIDELHNRKDDYPDHPKLQAKIKELLQYSPIEDGDFLFTPARAVSDYSVGDILIAPNPDSGIISLKVGTLPPGVAMDLESGRLYVQDATALVAGYYNVLVSTSDAIGGFTQHQLELPIGSTEIAYYEVAPYRVIEDYLQGDVLASPVTINGSMPIFQVRWGSEIPDIPTGVILDQKTGKVIVQDENVLEIGIYPVEVILTYQDGSESRHEFVLSFKQDRKAIYTFQPAKLLGEYKTGDTLASVSDDDGKIIQAQKNKLPDGMIIGKNGVIQVSDPKELRPGTHRFNVLTVNKAKYQAVKTLFITLDADPNPFYYDVLKFGPIDTLKKNIPLANLKSVDSTIVASKVVLAKGMMPPGTELTKNGDVTVLDENKMVAGNYDLSMRVFIDLDAGELGELQILITNTESSLAIANSNLEQLQQQLVAANNDLVQYQVQQYHEIEVLNAEIAEIEEKITTAEGEELYQLQQQLEEKRNELQGLMTETEAGEIQRLDAITSIKEDIHAEEAQIQLLEERLDGYEKEMVNLRTNRWVEYNVQLLLTLEEDNESAWHLEIPKFWDEYLDNEVVAQVIDCDGHETTDIIAGNLPPGMSLSRSKGRLSVAHRSQLVPGEYILQTRSTDINGGITNHRLAIVVGGQQQQNQILYTMLPTKPVNNYVENEIIGYPYLKDQQIVSSRITSGILPAGISMNPVTGELIVSDTTLLRSGEYNDIISKSVTESGATQYFEIDILILPEIAFDITVTPPKFLQDYQPDDVLISVQIAGAQQSVGPYLQGIQVVGGELVSGAAVSSANGNIYVKYPDKLVAGDYSLDLLMLESNGASDEQTIAYSIGLDSTTGSKPTGTTESGMLTVVMADQKDFHTLLNNDTLAGLESKETIASVYPKSKIPGVAVNVKTGEVFVKNREKLVRQQHELLMDVLFENTKIPQEEVSIILDFKPVPNYQVDEETLKFSLGVRDRLAELGSNAPKSSSTSTSSEIQNEQTGTMASASDSNQMASLDSTQASSEGESVGIIDWADNHVFHLSNSDMRKNYYLAKDDADNFKQYMAVVDQIVQVFGKGIDEPQRSLLLAIYNEIFVSAVSISMYRGDDVSIRKDNPVGRMYAEMDAHLDLIGSHADVTYIRENANFIADNMNPDFKNLIAHFAKLKT